MFTRTVTLAEFTKRFGRLAKGGAREAVERGLRAAGHRAVAVLQDRTQVSFDTGAMRRSWRSDVVGLRLLVVNDRPYSVVVDEGRRAGARMPPPAALEPWVRRKMKVPRDRVRGAAFMLARAIKRRGIKGKHIVAGAKLGDIVDQELARAAGAALRGR